MICPTCGCERPDNGLCHSEHCKRLLDEYQARLDLLNSQLDPAKGIVGGDGVYYPRYMPDGSDPFEP